MDRQYIDRRTDLPTKRQTDGLIDRYIYMQADREKNRWMDTQTDRQTDRKTGKADREMDKHADRYTYYFVHF
jgi:hypothetical protein